ncbi:MAG: hypothetical protein H6729_15920 [Deltaproteobacteria bacterium]|nr:hypothetical protein [Deltaproteobacteria bacterium]
MTTSERALIAASPNGEVTVADCSQWVGWVCDPDQNTPTYLAVYSDREATGSGGFFWGWFLANQTTSAQPNCPGDGNHGFDVPLPEGLKNGRAHELWFYGIDGNGEPHTVLGKRTITCSGSTPVVPKSLPPDPHVVWIDPHRLTGTLVNRFAQNLTNAEFQNISALQFFVVAMEGLVNRTKPRIYINDTMYDLTNTGTDHWRSEVEAEIGATFEEVPGNDPYTLAALFASDPTIKGIARYDASLWTDHTRGDLLNYLTGYCAIHDCLPVTPAIEAELLQRSIHFAITADFTDQAFLTANDLLSHEGIYHRLTEILRKDANHAVVASMHPQLFVLPRDYLFAHKILPIYIREDASAAEETQIVKLYASGLPVLGHVIGEAGSHNAAWLDPLFGAHGVAPIRGKYEEGGAWGLASAHGVTLDYVHATANLSLHSGFVVETFERPTHPTPSYDPSKVVLTFHLSDGDNISWVKQLWASAWDRANYDRSLKLNWSFNPLIADLAPLMVRWFYAHATANDYLMPWSGPGSIENAVFGIQTADPQQTRQAYRAETCAWLRRLDQKFIYLTFSRITPAQIAEWADAECLDAIFSDYNINLGAPGLPSATYENATYRQGDVGVFRPILSLGNQTEAEFLADLASKTPSERPAFMQVWVVGNRALYPATDGTLANVMRSIDPSVYQIVTADDFVQLWRQAEGLPCNDPCSPGGDAGPAEPRDGDVGVLDGHLGAEDARSGEEDGDVEAQDAGSGVQDSDINPPTNGADVGGQDGAGPAWSDSAQGGCSCRASDRRSRPPANTASGWFALLPWMALGISRRLCRGLPARSWSSGHALRPTR